MEYVSFKRFSPDAVTAYRRDGTAKLIERGHAEWDAVSEKAGPYVAPPPPPVTGQDIRKEAARRLRLIGSPYTDEERETWAAQVEGAKALGGDPNASAPLVRALAEADGVTPQDMAETILAKATAYEAASAVILSSQRTLLRMEPIPQDYRDDKHWSAE